MKWNFSWITMLRTVECLIWYCVGVWKVVVKRIIKRRAKWFNFVWCFGLFPSSFPSSSSSSYSWLFIFVEVLKRVDTVRLENAKPTISMFNYTGHFPIEPFYGCGEKKRRRRNEFKYTLNDHSIQQSAWTLMVNQDCWVILHQWGNGIKNKCVFCVVIAL